MGFDMRYAVIVEVKSVVDLGPFEIGLTKRFDGLIPKDIER